MKWTVKKFDHNKREIKDYDLFPYFEKFLLELKKKRKTKEEFAEAIKHELMYHYWSRYEYELIIQIKENGCIFLAPFSACKDDEKATIEVTNDTGYDWKGFAEKHVAKQRFGNEAKIDIWNQIEYRFDEFATYCWDEIHTRKTRKE